MICIVMLGRGPEGCIAWGRGTSLSYEKGLTVSLLSLSVISIEWWGGFPMTSMIISSALHPDTSRDAIPPS